jgi:hypothetical protein
MFPMIVFKINLGDDHPEWAGKVVGLCISIGVGIATGTLVFFFVVPWMRRAVAGELFF